MLNDKEFHYDKLELIKNNLMKTIEENNDKISKINRNIGIIEKTRLMSRLFNFSWLVALGMPIALVVQFLIVFYFKLPASVIETTLVSTMLFGSIAFGALTERIPASINKRKLKQITNAKTSEEKKEEMLKNRIELEKITNKNIALKNAYDYACKKQDAFKYYENELTVSKTENIEELNEKSDVLNTQIKETEEKLDVVSTQNALNFEILGVRNRVYKLGRNVLITLLVMFTAGVGTFVSILAINPFSSTIPSFVLPTCIATGALGGLVYTGLSIKNNKEDMRIFEKFNKALGKNRMAKYDEDNLEKSKLNRRTQQNTQVLSKMYFELNENEVNIGVLEKEKSREELAQKISTNYTVLNSKTSDEEVFFNEKHLVREKEKGEKTLVKR